MLAQVSLIPAESKKLIAKAVIKMEVLQEALREGGPSFIPVVVLIASFKKSLGVNPLLVYNFVGLLYLRRFVSKPVPWFEDRRYPPVLSFVFKSH